MQKWINFPHVPVAYLELEISARCKLVTLRKNSFHIDPDKSCQLGRN